MTEICFFPGYEEWRWAVYHHYGLYWDGCGLKTVSAYLVNSGSSLLMFETPTHVCTHQHACMHTHMHTHVNHVTHDKHNVDHLEFLNMYFWHVHTCVYIHVCVKMCLHMHACGGHPHIPQTPSHPPAPPPGLGCPKSLKMQ